MRRSGKERRGGRGLPWALAAMLVWAWTAPAQLTVQKTVQVNTNVPDNGLLRWGFTWAESGLSAIDQVAVTLHMSSPFSSNPIDLSDLYGNIRHGTTGDVGGVRSGSLFTAGQMISLSQTFQQAASLDGAWLPSNSWRLDLGDNQSGNVARLDSFTFAVTGTAADGGTLDAGEGGMILANGAGVQAIAANLQSSGSGADAVGLVADVGETLQVDGQLQGAGDFRVQGGGSVQLKAAAAGFSGKVTVDSGQVEVANSAALGTGSLEVASGAALRLAAGVNLSNAVAVIGTNKASLAGGSSRADVSTLSGVISGNGGLQKTGAGTVAITATNTFTGVTEVMAGVLVINGDISSSSKTTVGDGGTLGGSGRVGALEIANGGTLAVGNSPGTLNAGSTTWAGGGAYEWEINNFLGASGSNWDFLNITGTLDITATAGNRFLIDVVSLLADDTRGLADNFNALANYNFAIATASGGISGFDAAAFTLSTANFANSFYGGVWSLSTAAGEGSSVSLMLNYTGATAIPEPNSAGLVLLGLVTVLARTRRYRRSAV